MARVYLSETRRVGTRLAHNTEIVFAPGTSGGLIRDFIRPAVRAIPFGIAERVGLRRVSLAPGDEESGVASRWVAVAGRGDRVGFQRRDRRAGAPGKERATPWSGERP